MAVSATILTRWSKQFDASLNADVNKPEVLIGRRVDKYRDVTGQSGRDIPTTPNMVVIYVEAPAAMIDELDADPHCEVVSRSDTRDDREQPGASDVVRLRKIMSDNGTSNVQITQALGTPTPQNRTRRQLINSLRAWLKLRPAGIAIER